MTTLDKLNYLFQAISKSGIAEEIGVDRVTFSNILSGRRRLRPHEEEIILKRLDRLIAALYDVRFEEITKEMDLVTFNGERV